MNKPNVQPGDTPESQTNRLLGVLGVSTETCPANSDLRVMLWYAIDAALKQSKAFQDIHNALKEKD